jgi:hypothetical protein
MLFSCITGAIKMGGRKSYPSKNLIGSSRETKKKFEELKDSFDTQEPKAIAQKTLDVFFSSDQAVLFHSYATKLAPYILKNIKKLRSEKDEIIIKRDLSTAWQQIKEEYNISVPKEIDTVIVNNAVKTVKGAKHE